MSVSAATATLWTLFQQRGDDAYHGEPVSQLEHAVQAARIALDETGDTELAIAALLHDIGHLLPSHQEMNGFGMLHHEALGANFLRELGFSTNVVRLVGGHVAAKRYLTFADPGYYAQLSAASKETLVFQGGVMTAEEANHFQRDPLFERHLLLRRIDERAKLVGLPAPDLSAWKALVATHLAGQAPQRRGSIW